MIASPGTDRHEHGFEGEASVWFFFPQVQTGQRISITGNRRRSPFIPAGIKPAAGWPVVLFGHGSADALWQAPFNIAAQMAAHGLATVCINLEGNGSGQTRGSRSRADGGPLTFPLYGRKRRSDGPRPHA